MAEAAPRLYLITPKLAEAAAFDAAFEAALAAGDIACVLLRMQMQAGSDSKKLVARFAALARKHDTALLIEDPQLAARCDADGVHVGEGGMGLEAAVAAMKPDRIVGVGGLSSRHDAMLAGESGADYVMFGDLDAEEDSAAIIERIAWWAEIFTLPCVAYAQTLADVAPLAAAGADFIALDDAVWEHPHGAAAAVQAAMLALASAHEPAR
ncbi:MAG: thiamine phosphate synthase [Beijerinckiaceae bacterium]|nr:MAG: thiamine phosphate synthase [Beijerinckiaceae bacterium]